MLISDPQDTPGSLLHHHPLLGSEVSLSLISAPELPPLTPAQPSPSFSSHPNPNLLHTLGDVQQKLVTQCLWLQPFNIGSSKASRDKRTC
jgi:hypothetical protein